MTYHVTTKQKHKKIYRLKLYLLQTSMKLLLILLLPFIKMAFLENCAVNLKSKFLYLQCQSAVQTPFSIV